MSAAVNKTRNAHLSLLHEVPPALRQLLKEARFEWATWNASWRHADTRAEITLAELREHLDEGWLRQRIREALGARPAS
jgi:hypothetical protein